MPSTTSQRKPLSTPRILRMRLFAFVVLLAAPLGGADTTAPERPALAAHGGVRHVDLNGDGHEDLVVSNPQGYGVYLFNPVEAKHVDWKVGWTQVLREGAAGDANSLPLIQRPDGGENEVVLEKGVMTVRTAEKQHRLPFSELLRVPGPPPMSPAESLRCLQTAPGWEAKLVASEPLLRDPVFFDWDERGRLWVVEMGDYPFAPGETTRDGAVGQGKVSEWQSGRVKILEDTDGDGVHDKATLFLDGLKHPTGLACWRGGVFVANIPDIFYARDSNGDGVCDERETWVTGFTAGNPQHLVNGFCLGLDGWFYGANGDSGGDLHVIKTGQQVKLGTQDFRFHPDTGEFRLEAGRTQFGRWRDDFGNWFGNNNSTVAWHYFLPLAYLEKHPERTAKTLRAITNEDKTVFPIAPPQRRFNWADATHTLTAGCSPVPWRQGDETWLLVCEPQNNLVRREQLDYNTFPLRSTRHPEDHASEFLASTDPWFRPVLARPGPDGALYVADLYRLVLEHPEWIPAELAKGLDLRAGESLGRLYRISRKDHAPAKPVQITTANAVATMASPVRWQRDTAQRLLLEEADPARAVELRALARATKDEPARLQLLWTAHLLDGAQADDLVKALQSAHPRARGAALVAAGSEAIHPQELATWFTSAKAASPVAAAPVITKVNPDRQKVVARYVKALAGKQGDATRGTTVYQRACMACHQLGGQGVELGPDLATVAAKPTEQIIEAIFDPHRAVEDRNAVTEVRKKDGSVVAGLLAAETPHHLTLRLAGGVEIAVPRVEIRETKTLKLSLMPEGLEAVLSEQDCADLLARMRQPSK